ncbi:MAG TPA: ABC transporter ATP-binding protein [bacterium]|nr:ABC transporter ATP-binding protein [bacterium]HPP29767.1 ABC transporter ATP-binding protein [bacterium]
MEKLVLENISKRFGRTEVLKNISLSVEKDEIFFILGPSGCGKTTLLRIIAGFVSPDSGRIILNNKDITTTPPAKRNIGLVFQNYALWPHLSVWKNISYGLEVKRYPQEIIKKKVERVLDITKLSQFKDLFPTKLSGGQQQRVALARAIVNEPEVLLLDEPLSNLDAKLREEMRSEIQRIQRETGITMVYVTHDRREAMAAGKRIAVINNGKILEIGSPVKLYSNPVNRFTAEFLGEMNILSGRVEKIVDNYIQVITDEGLFTVTKKVEFEKDRKVEIGFRPENINLEDGENKISGDVKEIEYSGETARVKVSTSKGNIFFVRVFQKQLNKIETGKRISFSISPEDIVVFTEK